MSHGSILRGELARKRSTWLVQHSKYGGTSIAHVFYGWPDIHIRHLRVRHFFGSAIKVIVDWKIWKHWLSDSSRSPRHMIHLTYQCIFIHIPRTGGSSVEEALWSRKRQGCWWGYDDRLPGFLQHLTCRQILDQGYVDRATFRQYFKFTFVRNPWDRCLSEHIWRIKKAGNFVDAPINIEKHGSIRTTAEYIRNNVTFKEFLNRDFPWHEVSYHQHESSQCAYLMNSNGEPLVDFIGRFEQLQQDFNTICDTLAIPRKKLKHKNRTNHTPYWEYYDDETRKIVAEKYCNDIETFDYKFGE